MKNLFKLAALAALTVFAVACDKDENEDNDNGGNGKNSAAKIVSVDQEILSEMEGKVEVHQIYRMEFKRDAQDRISEITTTQIMSDYQTGEPVKNQGWSGSFAYSGSGAKLTVRNYGYSDNVRDNEDYEVEEYDLEFNGNGYITKISMGGELWSGFTYDSDGQMTKINGTDEYSSCDFTWKGGDMISTNWTTYTYNDETNTLAGGIDFTMFNLNEWFYHPLYFYACGMLGKHTKHLVKTETGENNDVTTFTYEKDGKGRIKSILLTMSYDGMSYPFCRYVMTYE